MFPNKMLLLICISILLLFQQSKGDVSQVSYIFRHQKSEYRFLAEYDCDDREPYSTYWSRQLDAISWGPTQITNAEISDTIISNNPRLCLSTLDLPKEDIEGGVFFNFNRFGYSRNLMQRIQVFSSDTEQKRGERDLTAAMFTLVPDPRLSFSELGEELHLVWIVQFEDDMYLDFHIIRQCFCWKGEEGWKEEVIYRSENANGNFQENRDIYTVSQSELTENSYKITLTITHLQKEDAGQYTLVLDRSEANGYTERGACLQMSTAEIVYSEVPVSLPEIPLNITIDLPEGGPPRGWKGIDARHLDGPPTLKCQVHGDNIGKMTLQKGDDVIVEYSKEFTQIHQIKPDYSELAFIPRTMNNESAPLPGGYEGVYRCAVEDTEKGEILSVDFEVKTLEVPLSMDYEYTGIYHWNDTQLVLRCGCRTEAIPTNIKFVKDQGTTSEETITTSHGIYMMGVNYISPSKIGYHFGVILVIDENYETLSQHEYKCVITTGYDEISFDWPLYYLVSDYELGGSYLEKK